LCKTLVCLVGYSIILACCAKYLIIFLYNFYCPPRIHFGILSAYKACIHPLIVFVEAFYFPQFLNSVSHSGCTMPWPLFSKSSATIITNTHRFQIRIKVLRWKNIKPSSNNTFVVAVFIMTSTNYNKILQVRD